MAKKFDLKTYETELVACIERAVRGAMEEYPDEHFYAAALHEFYRESGDVIALPCLAVNTKEEVDEAGDNLWSSPDWYWTELDFASKKLVQLHDRMTKEASRLDTDHWSKVHAQWLDVLVRAAKQLTARLNKLKPATNDFGFYLFDEDNEIELLRRCTSAAKFKRLFPQLHAIVEERKADSKRPVSQKLAKYREDLYAHRDELLSHGQAAIPILIDALDGEKGWCAADLLKELGIADSGAIQALRHRVCLPENGSERWQSRAASALANLGDIDFLLEIAKKARTRDVAIGGIKALYSGSAKDGRLSRPLDYRPIERLLEMDSCRRLTEKVPRYADGFSYALPLDCFIRRENVDVAIRGTKSKYKMIREHAVSCLGNRDLGKVVSERAMQAIVDRFNDRAMTVRFLAAISIGDWKRMAKGHLPAIRKMMRNDHDPDVR